MFSNSAPKENAGTSKRRWPASTNTFAHAQFYAVKSCTNIFAQVQFYAVKSHTWDTQHKRIYFCVRTIHTEAMDAFRSSQHSPKRQHTRGTSQIHRYDGLSHLLSWKAKQGSPLESGYTKAKTGKLLDSSSTQMARKTPFPHTEIYFSAHVKYEPAEMFIVQGLSYVSMYILPRWQRKGFWVLKVPRMEASDFTQGVSTRAAFSRTRRRTGAPWMSLVQVKQIIRVLSYLHPGRRSTCVVCSDAHPQGMKLLLCPFEVWKLTRLSNRTKDTLPGGHRAEKQPGQIQAQDTWHPPRHTTGTQDQTAS